VTVRHVPLSRARQRLVRARRLLPLAAGLAAMALPIAAASVAAAATLSDTPLKTTTVNGRVRETAYSGTTLYLVGEFTSATDNGVTVTRNHAAAIDTTTGHLLAWNPNVNGNVYAVAVDPVNARVYLGGNFTTVGGAAHKDLARVVFGTGAVDATWAHSAQGTVWSMSVGNLRLYIGGGFATVDNIPRGGLAAFTLLSGHIDSIWLPQSVGGKVRAVSATSTRIYVAGEGSALDGVAQFGKLGAVNPSSGALDKTFNAHMPYRVFKLDVTPTAVYAAADGHGGHLWSISLAGAQNWIVTADGGFQAATVIGGLVVAGGHFDNVCKTPSTGPNGTCLGGATQRKKLAAFSPTTGALQTYAPQADSAEGVFTLQSNAAGTQMAVGGDFTTFHFKTIKQAHVALFAFS
jgi:hypothetical protein